MYLVFDQDVNCTENGLLHTKTDLPYYIPTKHTQVYELHFHKDHIVWEVSHQGPKTEKIVSAPIKHPRLKADVILS